MDSRVERLETTVDCENFERNAVRLGEPDLAKQARQRKVMLKAASYGATTQVERECLEAIYAYEETLFAKNGKRTRAIRTWRMVENRGILPAVERAVNRASETQGFRSLQEMGLSDYAFEAVILRYPAEFSADAVSISMQRMADRDSE